jgi:hypothetical protein
MDLRVLLTKLLLGILFGAVIGTVLVGFLGLLVAGWEGLVNGAIWGFFLGLFGGVSLAGIVEWSYWKNFMTRLGRGLQKGK